MQKTVIINRGIPASGKSSFAKEIVSKLSQKGLSAISCSTDDYFMVDGVYRFDAERLREYHLKNQNRFKQALKEDFDVVICDNTNIEPWEARPYYDMAKEFEYNVILMDFGSRDIQSHIKAQSNEDYKHNIPEDTLINMQDRYYTYKELTDKNSYPTTTRHPKRTYNEDTQRVESLDEQSEPFYYDDLIKIDPFIYHQIKKIIGNLVFKKIRDYSYDEIKLIPRHYKEIMKEFHKRADKTLTAYDLEDILGKSPKQIKRYIDDLKEEFHNIIEIHKGKKKAYRLVDDFDIFIKAFDDNDNLEYLFYEIEEDKDSRTVINKLKLNPDSDIYMFKNSIFEYIDNKDNFKKLKDAIKNNLYKDIEFIDKDEVYREVKPVKLVFTDNNWYLAYVKDNILELGRVSFIKSVRNSYKNSYQPSSVKEHLKLLNKRLQNSMTLFDIEPKVATLKAKPNIARYFKPGMKKFLSSQEFIKELEDGSVIFSVKYTQELEILPFVQKWLPDLIILEPKELIDTYINKLKQGVNNHLN